MTSRRYLWRVFLPRLLVVAVLVYQPWAYRVTLLGYMAMGGLLVLTYLAAPHRSRYPKVLTEAPKPRGYSLDVDEVLSLIRGQGAWVTYDDQRAWAPIDLRLHEDVSTLLLRTAVRRREEDEQGRGQVGTDRIRGNPARGQRPAGVPPDEGMPGQGA